MKYLVKNRLYILEILLWNLILIVVHNNKGYNN